MSFRDPTVIIIETGRTVVRAGLGLHELLKTPSVEVPARVGYRRNGDISVATDDSKRSINRETRLPQLSLPNASVNDYLVGSALDEALAAGQDISISWPFAGGDISDWTQAEAIWKYVLFNQLKRRRTQMESPVLLSIFPCMARVTYERICQMFFERFNVVGLSILDRPMAQVYSANSLSGVIVDIDAERTDITPIYDSHILRHAILTTPVGMEDCEKYLANLLRSNQNILSSLSPSTSPIPEAELQNTLLELVRFLREEGHIKVPSDGETIIQDDDGVTDIAAIVVAGREKAVIENGMKKRATARASAAEQARAREIEALDLLTIQFKGHSLTVGKERHRLCEPLFDPTLLDDSTSSPERLSIQAAVGLAVGKTDIVQRQHLYNGLYVTGDINRFVKGIGVALQSRLSPYILSTPEFHNELQPRIIRVLHLPEYYPEYRETGEGYAAFLGSSIVAKIIFINDAGSRSFVSKNDYGSRGPHSIIEASPSLL